MVNFAKQSGLDWAQNSQFWLNFNKNLNISAEFWSICTKPSEQGSFFWASQNESKECYAMIKTDEITLISQQNHDQSAPNLQNRARFSKLDKMSPRSAVLWSKLMET